MFSAVGEISFSASCGVNRSYLSAMAVMIYALYTYHWRAASIRRGGRGPYDDRVGPVSVSLRCLVREDFQSLQHRPSCVLHCSVSVLLCRIVRF